MTNGVADIVERLPDGSWRVVGTRVSFDSVVRAYWDGRLPESIVADFPSLTLAKVYGTIAIYLQRRDDFDHYLQQQDERWRQFQADSAAKHGPLVQRLRGSAGVASETAP